MWTRSPTRPCARPLKKNALQPHRRKMWCIPDKPSAEFVFHLEDVLAVYHRPYDPKRPVVCVDETFKQLIGETREPLPPRPGSVERVDYVYTRNGVASLFLACEPLAGWRHIEVTEHRRRTDWAGFIRALLSSSSMVSQRMAASFGIEFPDGVVDGLIEVVRSGEGLMSEVMPLEVAPETLDIVQLRSVFRQPLDPEPMSPLGEGGTSRLAGVDRAVVEDEHEGLERDAELGAIAPLNLLQESDEVRASFGPAGAHDELAPGPVEHPEHRHFG